ncbi:ABC transporter permease [Alkalihalobacillus sp. CinArs1]|uniref:ABC transporter permease n=1 Tax=Alkalihalobacillus sp. CinArs1 TaxID=2995314 RepID=UPI0022DDCAF8|nr:ABC transporter permease subunit [Alkalihalobacillus sp. CinArs1]
MKALLLNPVLNKEFKLRLRSFKSYLGILIYLIVLGSIGIGFIFLTTMNARMGYFRPEESRVMFMVLSMVQLGLILFMTPGLTAGVISGERERQTLNMLLTTKQSSGSIIVGKLLSSLSFLLLIIVASLPLYSITFLFGGVAPRTILATFGLYMITILTIGSLGVMFSTLIRKTIVSMITTYGVALFLTAFTAFVAVLSIQFISMGGPTQTQNPIPYLMLMGNPAAVLMTVFEPSMQKELMKQSGISIPLWISYLFTCVFLITLSLWISISKLRPNMRVNKRRKA